MVKTIFLRMLVGEFLYYKLHSLIPIIKNTIGKIITNEILISFVVFVIAAVIVVQFTVDKVDYPYDKEFWRDVYVEAHGMLFDIFIIGTLIFALHKLVESRKEKRRNIQRWQEEIDDYRGWDEKEAMHRIVGNIKRLNKQGIAKVNLSDCYLKNAKLRNAHLRCSDLQRANLQYSDLKDADFQSAKLINSNFKRSNLFRTNFQGANMENSCFEEVNLGGSNLQKANLQIAEFQRANLELANLQSALMIGIDISDTDLKEANLKEANLSYAFLYRAKLWMANLKKAKFQFAKLDGTELWSANLEGADLRKAENLTVEQLSKVKTLYQAKLDPELETEIKEKYPHLLEKPEDETEEE